MTACKAIGINEIKEYLAKEKLMKLKKNINKTTMKDKHLG